MHLKEANKRLKTPITEEQLSKIHVLYCLLGLDKDPFCRLVDAVGVDELEANTDRYCRLFRAERMLKEKEECQKYQVELGVLTEQKHQLEDEIHKVQCKINLLLDSTKL